MSRTLSRLLGIAGLIASLAASGRTQAQPQALPAAPAQALAPAEASGVSTTVFWFAASASIITASLGGFYAIHVKDLYDEANLQPLISPERSRIRREMQHAELTADILLFSSLAMAIGTTILTFYVDWDGADPAPALAGAERTPPRRTWW